jgi:FkbM family methyltransferase
MINFSSIPINSFLGKLLRLPLKLIPRTMVVPILQGSLKGRRWISGSANHGCWLGSYEPEWQRVFSERVLPGSVVYDVGANVGFHTLLFAEVVGPKGKVFAFEPFPDNLDYLVRHVKINKITNVEIVGKAVLDRVGDVSFQVGATLATGKIATGGSLQVPGTDLDSFVYVEGNTAPKFIKIDVEGAEGNVLAGAKRLIEETSPIIFLETHGKAIHQYCISLLHSYGYELVAINGTYVGNCDQLMALPSGKSVVPIAA